MGQSLSMLSTVLAIVAMAAVGSGITPREESAPARALSLAMTFASDTTWASFEMAEGGGLGAAAGPAQRVCLLCQPMPCPPGGLVFYHEHCGWKADLTAIPGARWIWRSGIRDTTRPASLQGAFFSREFDIPGLPTAGEIFISADDSAAVIVNGVRAGSIGSLDDLGLAGAAQRALTRFDIGPLLVQGANQIVVFAQNGPQYFGSCPGCFALTASTDSLTLGSVGDASVFEDCSVCSYSGNPAGTVFGGTISYVVATPARRSSWGSVKARFR